MPTLALLTCLALLPVPSLQQHLLPEDQCPPFEEMTCEHFQGMASLHGRLMGAVLACLGYDKFDSPVQEGAAMNLSLDTRVNKIVELNTVSQKMVVDVVVTLGWWDTRLALPPDCYEPDDLEQSNPLDPPIWGLLWQPDLQIDGLLGLETVLTFKAGERLAWRPDGAMMKSGRFHVSVNCPMDFTVFPFDQQACGFNFFVDNRAKIVWQDHNRTTLDLEALYLTQHLHMPDWSLSVAIHDHLPKEVIVTPGVVDKDGVSGVSMVLEFGRVYTNHLLHTFVPSMMLCLGSVLSLYVPPDLVPGRMGLCVTSFLSVISLFNGARSTWPSTAYMKAIDMWTSGCYLVVFTAMAEYCVVLYLTQRAEFEVKVRGYKRGQGQLDREHKRQQLKRSKTFPAGKGFFGYVGDTVTDYQDRQITSNEILASHIETFTRIGVIAYLVVFNLVYWTACLS